MSDHEPVAVPGRECSDEQKASALDYDDDTYSYLIPWDRLTEEQKRATGAR